MVEVVPVKRNRVGVIEGVKLGKYLRPTEVAEIMRVTPRTVTRWAEQGKLPHSRTLGGHRRFPAELILDLAQKKAKSLTVDAAARLLGTSPSTVHRLVKQRKLQSFRGLGGQIYLPVDQVNKLIK